MQAEVDAAAASGASAVTVAAGEDVTVNETVSLPADVKVVGEAKPEKQTPLAWAVGLGIAPKANPLMPFIEPVAKSTQECPNGIHYHAADVLHGWSHHAYNFQADADAFLLSKEDFLGALAAAAEYPACGAHMPAVAKHAPFRKELEARAAAEKSAAESKDKP